MVYDCIQQRQANCWRLSLKTHTQNELHVNLKWLVFILFHSFTMLYDPWEGILNINKWLIFAWLFFHFIFSNGKDLLRCELKKFEYYVSMLSFSLENPLLIKISLKSSPVNWHFKWYLFILFYTKDTDIPTTQL